MNIPRTKVPGGPPIPDVDALMRRVRAGVADKIGSGVYAPAELEAARRFERELCGSADSGPAPADDFVRVNILYDPLGPHTFTSHRVGVGKLVVAAKQWLRRLVRPVASVALARQAEFNGAVARLLSGASAGVRALDAGNEALLRRLGELERRNQELHARCDELQTEVRELQARPGPDGRAVEPG
jgi:hypothetical protein